MEILTAYVNNILMGLRAISQYTKSCLEGHRPSDATEKTSSNDDIA
jgi:hypothetical protein